jgi:hypothetical protein
VIERVIRLRLIIGAGFHCDGSETHRSYVETERITGGLKINLFNRASTAEDKVASSTSRLASTQ